MQTIAAKYERDEYPRELTIIMVSPQPVESLPYEIEKLITVIDIPNPTEKEIENYIEENIPVSEQFEIQSSELVTDFTRTLQGLQQYEIEQIVRSTRVRTGDRLTEKTISYALEEKKSIVKKSGIIEVVDSNISFDQVGGLQTLQKDLKQKATLFRHLNEISKVKLPLPKGVLIIGMPGCGKSLIAKSIANEFGVSLLRLDINRLMGQYVGQSEANLRRALSTAEAAHPCVLWIDEIEKAFAGVGGDGGGNDVTTRLFGQFLTWMQEKENTVFVVATANDISKMPPEFLRKGRFDELFFVDLPNGEERRRILDIHLKKRNKWNKEIDVIALIKETDGFNGADLEAVVKDTIEMAFIEGKDIISTEDLMKSVRDIKSISKTLKEKIEDIRNRLENIDIKPASVPDNH